METGVLFSETQKFNQWWLYLIMTIAALLVIGAFIITFMSKLETEIRTDGITLRYFPLHLKTRFHKWDEFSKVYVRKYSPLSEYGGWGIKGFGDDKAWNVSGSEGLQLVFKNGKKLLVGTCKSEELKSTLMKIGQYRD